MGVEMTAGHSCILADLPTNGLDSASALGLLQAMAYSCVGGFSLLFSIVQASQSILDLVDRLILLCKGSIIDTGPPSQAELLAPSSIGFRRPAREGFASKVFRRIERKPGEILDALSQYEDRSNEDPGGGKRRNGGRRVEIWRLKRCTNPTNRSSSKRPSLTPTTVPLAPLLPCRHVCVSILWYLAPPRFQAYFLFVSAWEGSPATLRYVVVSMVDVEKRRISPSNNMRIGRNIGSKPIHSVPTIDPSNSC